MIARGIGAVLVLAVAAGGYAAWQHYRSDGMPAGIFAANGRLEAREYDIAAKRAGRIAQVLAEEGDDVEAGQLVARMDTDELRARLAEGRAEVARSDEAVAAARARVARAESESALARDEYARIQELFDRGVVAENRRDVIATEREVADAMREAARARLVAAEAAREAVRARVTRIQAELDDADLRAPVAGKIRYRLAEPGEVVAAGGRILSLVDLDDVRMIVFLPADPLGAVGVGDPARIVATGMDDHPFPGTVSFVADRAQFTPKFVETEDERRKLMFRVEVAADHNRDRRLKPGLPGVAYFRRDGSVDWPPRLEPPSER